MQIELKVPEVGEAVQEALLAQWLKRDGEMVHKDDIVFVIETDKVTLEISAPADGVLRILVEEGKTVTVGSVVGTIEAEAEKVTQEKAKPPEEEKKQAPPKPPPEKAERAAPPSVTPPAAAAPGAQPAPPPQESADKGPIVSSSVRALAEGKGIDLASVRPTGPGGRITEGDVLLRVEARAPEKEDERRPMQEARGQIGSTHDETIGISAGEQIVRKTMSPLRQRIAARLLDARRNTAMLTTFNEIDMSHVQALRKEFGDEFRKKYGVRLGIMSFFLKASIAALKQMPEVNAFIEGNEIVYHNYYHIGVAIGAERGLIVPVIRNADILGFAGMEESISGFVSKINEKRLDLSDLEGGTFTITNGGVFGSLLSTPILNPPQSAILGMHKIEERPIAVDGQVVIRPMMYVALSYDHRIIDGREAVTFLRMIKDFVENPARVLLEI